jgi:hypothetical protein
MTRDSTPSADGAGRASEVIAGYLEALDRGEAPDRRELLRQHPDIARELEDFFADQDQVEHLARSVAGPPGFPQPPQLNRPWRPHDRGRPEKKGGLLRIMRSRQSSAMAAWASFTRPGSAAWGAR